MSSIPGQCDQCPRPATSYFGGWTGGAPGAGQYRSSASCDYHLGDPPGSIPGRCWACGRAIAMGDEFWIYATTDPAGHALYVNFHATCPRGDDVAHWDGPQTCGHCEHPIAYGQPRNEHYQKMFDRTVYSHQTCPTRRGPA